MNVPLMSCKLHLSVSNMLRLPLIVFLILLSVGGGLFANLRLCVGCFLPSQTLRREGMRCSLVVHARDVPQRQRVSRATAVLTERERPLHPFPLQLPLGAVAAAVN